MNRKVISVLFRVIFGILYASFYLSAKDDGQIIVLVLAVFWGALAFIPQASWKEKTRINYWLVLSSGVLVLLSAIFIDVLLKE